MDEDKTRCIQELFDLSLRIKTERLLKTETTLYCKVKRSRM